MLKFEALHIPTLTQAVAHNLEQALGTLPGVQQLDISVEDREVHVTFDEGRLEFTTLVQVMGEAGCPLRSITAALLKNLSPN
jgi:copper chaperone CopZ